MNHDSSCVAPYDHLLGNGGIGIWVMVHRSRLPFDFGSIELAKKSLNDHSIWCQAHVFQRIFSIQLLNHQVSIPLDAK